MWQVYSFSGGRVKVANKKYSSLNAEYEINFDSNSTIILINDDNRIGSITWVFALDRATCVKRIAVYT